MMGSTNATNVSGTNVGTTNGYSLLTTTTTYRSSSTSAIMTSIRPQTLNVTNPREAPNLEAEHFISEALNAWRAKARCSVVPAERVQELFHELQFHPSERQISDMLQTAKKFDRKGSRKWNGLTFGEFCVLAADLKRFRTTKFASTSKKTKGINYQSKESDFNPGPNANRPNTSQKSRRSGSFKLPNERIKKISTSSESGPPVEVFLGGSCNPTTWRRDVAIPALKKLGISFYNPQVSDWTPDLIELEHKAKEKARVLFFVMDSETRASAGAIEAAHIAGQSAKQLVLVLHPYKPDQYILNEPLSHQEFIDLTRNQQILRELVSRRGLPVLDSIPLGLRRTKEILAGIADPPPNIASILDVVRGAFDRIRGMHDTITLEECQRALSILGYAQSFLTLENLKNIIMSQRNMLKLPCQQISVQPTNNSPNSFRNKKPVKDEGAGISQNISRIDFENFCILAAYLSVLQQEIHESGCISPIKGTNVPPPPVYLTNLQGFQIRNENITINYSTKQIFQANNTDVTTDDPCYDFLSQPRDSGTSSPQPIESLSSSTKLRQPSSRYCLKKSVKIETTASIGSLESSTTGEESDSNDSVFSSSGSSINSNCCSGDSAFSSFEIRDVYLGGSCYLRTKWRQDFAIPYLKSKNISFHLPALHESIQPSQFDLPEKSFEDSNSRGRKQNGLNLTDQQPYQIEPKNAKNSHEESSHLPLTRPNLYNPSLMDSSRVLLFIITNETRSLAPMTLAAHCIGLMYNVVLCVQMLPENCVLGNEKLTTTAIKDYNRGRSYLIDLAKRQGVPVFNDLKSSLECTAEKVRALHSQKSCSTEEIEVMKSGSTGVK